MAATKTLAEVVASITEMLPTIEQKLGEVDWETFQEKLLPLLERLRGSSIHAEQEDIIKEMLGLDAEFSQIGAVMRYLRNQSGLSGLVDAAVRPISKGETDLVAATEALVQAVGGDVKPSEEAAPPDRFLNTGFFTSDGSTIDPETPLLLTETPFLLRVNIGGFWGIGAPDKRFPDRLLEPHYLDDMVELIVAARSPDAQISPAYQPLKLPRQGDSPPVEFEVTLTRPGQHLLMVDVIYAGHLLQSRRVTFKVKLRSDETLPPSAWPVQDAYTTFTRSTSLDLASLETLAAQPRLLTIVVEGEQPYQQIGLRFFDQTGESLNFEVTDMSQATLTSGLQAIRETLLAMMKSHAENNGLNNKQLVGYLARAANQGRLLYRQMLPGLTDEERMSEGGQKLRAALKPGTIIQVAPLSPRLSVTWELLYERPVKSYSEDRTQLCDAFQTHGPAPEDCPHYENGHVICPHSFWGFRYIIEQLPGRLVRGQQPAHQTLPQWIHNEPPLSFIGLVYPKFEHLRGHWRRLRKLAPEIALRMQLLDTYVAVERFFENREEQPHLVYFYAHGGEIDGLPTLKVADGRSIRAGDLEAWRVDWRKTQPLLILNACQSAGYDPDSFEDMIQAFFRHGAAGVIGTQCTIYENLVDALMPSFLTAFLQQVPVGQALLDARRALMWQQRDPRGLAYSLFATADLRLAEQVLESGDS